MPPQGFYIEEESLKTLAYNLVSQLLAMHDLDNLAYSPYAPDAVNDLLQFGEKEWVRNAMSLAALSRANDDTRGGLKEHLTRFPHGVGTLTIEGQEDKVLSPRDACNKIIHNTSVELDFEVTRDNPLYTEAYKLNWIQTDCEYRVPYLLIQGKGQGEKGKAWNAKVNMIQWIFAAAYFGS